MNDDFDDLKIDEFITELKAARAAADAAKAAEGAK